MEVLGLIFVFFAGVAGGFVNAVSAAGSLITLPALQFAGLSPQVANATNRIGILVQNTAALIGYRSKNIKPDKDCFYMSLATFPGGIIGALFSLKIPDELFNKILAVVILVFLLMLVFFPIKAKEEDERNDRYNKWGYLFYFLGGIYGGFIQAGTGFILMATTIYINRFGMIKTNLYKSVAMLIYTIAALIIFIWKGNINWVAGMVVSLGFFVGAFFASRWSVIIGEDRIRRIVMVLVVLMAIKLWFF